MGIHRMLALTSLDARLYALWTRMEPVKRRGLGVLAKALANSGIIISKAGQ